MIRRRLALLVLLVGFLATSRPAAGQEARFDERDDADFDVTAGEPEPSTEPGPASDDTATAATRASERAARIVVNLPAYALRLYDRGGREIRSYRVRIGKTAKATRTGRGEISRRFSPAYFRYADGPKAGEIIRYSNVRNSLRGPIVKRIKIPYERVRGLEIRLGDEITGQILHSTTNPETLGHAVSSGCIGLSIPDMLDLYARVRVGTPIEIRYDRLEILDGEVRLYEDPYGRRPDLRETLEEALSEAGVPWTDSIRDEILGKLVKPGRYKVSRLVESLERRSREETEVEPFPGETSAEGPPDSR